MRRIANYRTTETKEERLDSSRISLSSSFKNTTQKNRHTLIHQKEVHIAILPMDEHCVIFKAMSKIGDDYYFHDIKSYINVNNNVLHLFEINGNIVKMNYNYLIQNVLSWNGVER